MTPEDAILLETLARVDALFLPIRGVDKAAINVYQRRNLYPKAGATWHRRSVDAAAERSYQRRRTELAAAGLLQAIGKSANVSGVKLTDAGDDRARALAGVPTLADCWLTLRRIDELRTDPDGTNEGSLAGNFAWTRETKLAGADYARTGDRFERKKLTALEDLLLPALVRGLCRSCADVAGRVWYSVLPGVATDPPPTSDELPKPSTDAANLYADELRQAQAALAAQAPPIPQDIALPLISVTPRLRGVVSK